jgi:hypothetical protein
MKKIRFLSVLLALCLAAAFMTAMFASCTGDPTGVESGTADATGQETGSGASSGEQSGSQAGTRAAEGPEADPSFFEIKTEVYDGVEYTYLSGVTEKGRQQKALEVPHEIDGKKIVGISYEAFKDCTVLETVLVHSNVEEWGGNIFVGCKALRTIRMDYADYVKAAREDPLVAEYFSAASAYDGTETGDNSIVCGLDRTKVRFVFPDQATYDFFATDYTWAIYAGLFTIES